MDTNGYKFIILMWSISDPLDEFNEKYLRSYLLHLIADFVILAKFETILRSLLKLEEKHVKLLLFLRPKVDLYL